MLCPGMSRRGISCAKWKSGARKTKDVGNIGQVVGGFLLLTRQSPLRMPAGG